MTTITIDGVGKVTVGADFLSLSADRQAAEIDAIVAQVKGAPVATPEVPSRTVATAGAAPAPTGVVDAASGAVGRIASRAGEVAKQNFGDQPFGLSEENIGKLRELGALPQEGQAPTPIQMINQIAYQHGPAAVDALLRTLSAGVGAVAGAAGQTAEELGVTGGGRGGRALERDIQALPQALAGMVPGASGPARTAATRPASAVPQVVARADDVVPVPAASGTSVSIAAPAGSAQFKSAAKPYYQVLDDSGVVVKPESIRALGDDIFRTTAREGLDPTNTPGSVGAIKRIQELADQPVTFQTLDTLRQVAGNIKGESHLKSIIIDKLDDFMAGIKSKDIILGTGAEAKAVSDAVNTARGLWHRAAKLEVIEDLVHRATVSVENRPQLGLENTLRTEFTNLAKSKERMRKFTPEEQKAINAVTKGPVKTAARALGRLAPTGPVSAMAAGGIGVTLGAKVGLDPLSSMVVIGTPAFAARRLASVLTQRSVIKIQDTIRKGGSSPMVDDIVTRGNAVLSNLKRDVLERDRSGRPTKTKPLGIGKESAIMEAAMRGMR